LSESSMGGIDDTGFSILSNTYGFPSRHSGLGSKVPGDGLVPGSSWFPCVLRNVSAMSQPCLGNVSAISLLPIGIFLLLSGASPTGPVGECAAVNSRIDVSVPVVGYRAFVFAASRHFVAGNRSTECGEPFLLVRHCSPRRRQQDSYRRFERVSCIGCPVKRAGKSGQTEKRRKNNS
jgi:hypothetical protein